MGNQLTLEHLQNVMRNLPEPQQRKMFVVRFDDLLSLFRMLRKASFRWQRECGASGKISIYQIYPVDSPFQIARLLVNRLNTGNPGELIMIDEPKTPDVPTPKLQIESESIVIRWGLK